MARPSYQEAEKAVRILIHYIEGGGRIGTLNTPRRVLDAWANDWGEGYALDEHKLKELCHTFDGAATGIVIVKDMTFFSHCEHHLAPFFGTCDIGYIPKKGRVLGLSKFARVINAFSKRLQMQETLTAQIADFLTANLSPDIIVTMSATHMCMVSRGVKQPNAKTLTAEVRGIFETDVPAREEFYRLVK